MDRELWDFIKGCLMGVGLFAIAVAIFLAGLCVEFGIVRGRVESGLVPYIDAAGTVAWKRGE